MRDLRHALILCALAVSVTAPTAVAQTLELGGSIGVSCKGSDGSFCNDTHSGLRTTGPFVSVTFRDRLEVGGRVAWLRQPDLGNSLPSEAGAFAITDRRRIIAQGEAIWHFRSGKLLRPLLGFGIGLYRDREVVTCEPSGCESRLASIGLSAGETRESHLDESLIVGLSVMPHKRVRVHGGWKYHNPFKDELALSEVFVALGFRPF